MNDHDIRNVGVIAITGPTAGKSVLRRSLHSVLKPTRLIGDDPSLVSVEMSDIIDWGAKQGGILGERIRDVIHLKQNGKFLPDLIMEPLFFEWLHTTFTPRKTSVTTLIIAGAPRTPFQSSWFGNFRSFRVYHLKASKEQTRHAILRRKSESGEKIRHDDHGGDHIIEQKWREYESNVLPAINQISDSCVHLDRSQPLKDRLTIVLEDLVSMTNAPVSKRKATRALYRLTSRPDHEVHRLIHSVEGHRPSISIQVSDR